MRFQKWIWSFELHQLLQKNLGSYPLSPATILKASLQLVQIQERDRERGSNFYFAVSEEVKGNWVFDNKERNFRLRRKEEEGEGIVGGEREENIVADMKG